MEEYVFVVMTDAASGRESEYNDWYNNVHLSDVVKVPGFISACRYVLADEQRRELPPAQPKYLAIYNIQTDDLANTMKVLGERSGTEEMPVSDSMVRGRSVVFKKIVQVVRSVEKDI